MFLLVFINALNTCGFGCFWSWVIVIVVLFLFGRYGGVKVGACELKNPSFLLERWRARRLCCCSTDGTCFFFFSIVVVLG